jgi:N-acetylglucosaminyldiphosphoundecaprenol N-acetyl-beta-D-mannosaminyltransferase
MGVGGSIDVLAGIQPRAPVWMQRSGLEWAFRLVRDPRGMWRRYLTTNGRFVWLLIRSLAARATGRSE